MSPFDQARYERLLGGLEATEIRRLELNEVLRIDAQYFQKRYLLEDACRRQFKSVCLGSQAFITDGPHGYHEVDPLSSIAMLTAKCAKSWFASRDDADTISSHTHQSNQRSSLQISDLILSTRGTVGACAIVEKDALPANIDQDVARIAISQNASIHPKYILAYLNSCFGQDWITRNSTGMVQQGLSLAKVRDLPIPVLCRELQAKIADMVDLASHTRRLSIQSLEHTETTLLSALSLDTWQPPEALTYVRNSRDAVAAGRFDAEYFYPAKTQAIAALTQVSSCVVGDLFNVICDLWQPDDGLPTELVKNYDLTDGLSPFLNASKEPVERGTIESTKKIIKPGDLVVSRLRSYLKEIALVQPSNNFPMVASTEFIVLRPKVVHALPVEALLIYLRSKLPQIILKWSQDGSNHPRFNEKELLRLPVPRTLIDDGDRYVKIIMAMIADRTAATQLLHTARRAVEIAIEIDEDAALAYLNQACEVHHDGNP